MLPSKGYTLFLIIACLSIENSAAGVSASEMGICTRIVRETKLVPQIETYRTFERVWKQCWHGACTAWKNVIGKRTVNKEAVETKIKSFCCTGYAYESHQGYCVPRCDEVCENGKCVAPNQCECNTGYKSFTAYRCIPDCGEHCINGRCIGPNMCECFDGYEKNSMDNCEPICTDGCVNGTCVDPEVCQCNEGFELRSNSTNVCDPYCSEGCHNGECIKPETCQCDDGYIFATPTSCIPDCGGMCAFGHCVSPMFCDCVDGYANDEQGDCEPMCTEGCVNGTCARPNECECDEGFKFQENSVSACEPHCSEECINGMCIAPDECHCHDGYEFANNSLSVCEPYCENCSNGTCLSPHNCRCNEGFEMIPIYSPIHDTTEQLCVKLCPEGYERDGIHQFTCAPSCDDCNNGDCLTPGQCTCWIGYRSLGNESNCQPFCEDCDSPNICGAPNHCFCTDGYIGKGEDTSLICVPHCESDCPNGFCFAPNLCKCNPGFFLNETGVCEAACQNECIFGECENGYCVCEAGFKLLEGSDHQCIPFCNTPCVNGVCQAPDECQCDEGYELQNGSECVPNCSKECQNGECIAHNMCECHEGYRLAGYQDHICSPICGNGTSSFDDEDDGCINGKCVSPNRCECLHGYIVQSDNQTCIIDAGFAKQNTDDKRSSGNWFFVLFAIFLILAAILGGVYLRNYYYREKNYDVGEKEMHLGVISTTED